MGFVTNEEIYHMLNDVQNEIAAIKGAKLGVKKELLIEELSISKAAKLVHTSSEIILRAIKKGYLRAMPHPSGDLTRLRIRVSDLLQWQDERASNYEIYLEMEAKEKERKKTEKSEVDTAIKEIIERARRKAGVA